MTIDLAAADLRFDGAACPRCQQPSIVGLTPAGDQFRCCSIEECLFGLDDLEPPELPSHPHTLLLRPAHRVPAATIRVRPGFVLELRQWPPTVDELVEAYAAWDSAPGSPDTAHALIVAQARWAHHLRVPATELHRAIGRGHGGFVGPEGPRLRAYGRRGAVNNAITELTQAKAVAA